MTVKTNTAEEVNCCPSLLPRDGPVLTTATSPVTDPARGGEEFSDGHAHRKEGGSLFRDGPALSTAMNAVMNAWKPHVPRGKPALFSVRSVQLPVRKHHVPRGELADSTQKPAMIP